VTQPSSSTQLVKAPRPEDQLLALAADVDTAHKLEAFRQASRVMRARLIRDASVQIANLSWGKDLSQHAQAGVARWCLERGIDPIRHIYILGGNLYDNANYYLDKLAVTPGYLRPEIVLLAPLDKRTFEELDDERLRKQLLNEQRTLNAARLRGQMEWGVPAQINQYPDTAAAALVKLWFAGQTEPVCGVNWAGSMGRKKVSFRGGIRKESDRDPVGDQDPVKTAITRALRKAAKNRIPFVFNRQEDDALASIEQTIDEARHAPAEDKSYTPVALPDDPYAETKPEPAQAAEPADEAIRAEDQQLAREG
jgi:hypothetical protein